MAIKIDNEGFLLIDREGKYKQQLCPLTSNTNRCGDWCPHFEGPYISYPFDTSSFNFYELHLCQGTIIRTQVFIDKRQKD